MNGYNDMMSWPPNLMFRPMQPQTNGMQMPAYQNPQMMPGMQAPLPSVSTPGGIPINYPTGQPTGPAYPSPEPTGTVPTIAEGGPVAPETVQSTMYWAGFLKTQIGRKVRVEFLIGTNGTTDRAGILIGVGASYIVLREEGEDNFIVCDLYSIKFVTVYL